MSIRFVLSRSSASLALLVAAPALAAQATAATPPTSAPPVAVPALPSGSAPSSAAPSSSAQDDEPRPTELAELVRRDARCVFRAESGPRARTVLVDAPMDVSARALAVLTIGAAHVASELARVESVAADGKPTELRAALYALGELGVDGYPALERALVREASVTSGNAENLIVALTVCARNGAPAALARLHDLADANSSLAPLASAGIAALDGGEGGPLLPAFQLYYELRWRAAQTFGLVDGQRWEKSVLARLYANDEFLDRVILSASADLPKTSLQAHLVEILLDGERPGALRVAAVLMPEELARAAESGEWRPSSLEAWHAILSEIDERRVERKAKKLCDMAFQESPELEPLAGMLLLRGGSELPWRWVGDQLTKGTPAARAKLVEACGDRGEKARIPDLADLIEKHKELGVFGEGLVALARLGHPPAVEAVENYAKSPPSSERSQVLAALAHVLHDKNVRRFADLALRRDDLEPTLRTELDIGLAAQGVASARERLRKTLPDLNVPSARDARLRAVRALSTGAEPADVEVLRPLYPVEDDLDLDVELALALLRARDKGVHTVLSAALWSLSWNRSVLAGGLIAHDIGLQSLIDELDSAPRAAREQDMRRVGFAIGEWGGVGAVEQLARMRSEGDAGLQGALLGALAAHAAEPEPGPVTRAPVKVEFAPLPPVPTEKAPKEAPVGRRRRGRGV